MTTNRVDEKYVELVQVVEYIGKAINFFKEREVLELTFDRKNTNLSACYWWFGQSPENAAKVLKSEIKLLEKKIGHSDMISFYITNNNQIQIQARWV